jgi:hypothetical protein
VAQDKEAPVTSIELLRRSAIAAVTAAVLAQSAGASGEPKNESPFTRPIATRSAQTAALPRSATIDIRGEPKNEWPFTRPVGNSATHGTVQAVATQPVIQGEPKNEAPFVGPAPLVSSSSGDFNWTDGAIGGIAGIGIALTAAGVLTVWRKPPRTA